MLHRKNLWLAKDGRIPPKYARFGVNLAENLQWKF